MPRVESLASYTPNLVTQLYDKNGNVFTTFARERRVMLKESEMPVLMERALVASEDSNFFQHGGIDVLGIGRAALADFRARRVKEGASTITMQLSRTLFLSRERTWRRKVEEAFVAVELEKNYTKSQILTLYLNLINFGHGNYGVEAASRYYFDKPAAKLTLPEAALLVGIIPAPSHYSPYRTPELMLRQRDRVLRRMLDEKYIGREEYERAVKQPILVEPQEQEESFAPYFAEDVRKSLEASYGANSLYTEGLQVQTTLDPQIQKSAQQAIHAGLLKIDHRRGWRGPIAEIKEADIASQQLPTWGQSRIVPGRWYQGLVLESGPKSASVKIGKGTYTLGPEGIAWTNRRQPDALLKRGSVAWFRFEIPAAKTAAVKTAAAKPGETPKPEATAAAAAAEPRLMLEQQPKMESAAVVIENQTGAIRAMVGGWDFDRNKFNRITQARRQVGSSFKPFVYGAAIEAGWTPSDTLLDAPTSFIGADGRLSYRPENYYHKHYGIVTLRRALEQSINVPAVKLFELVGGKRVVDFAHRLGVQTQLPAWPSVSLGSADLTPLEMASAYSTIANLGTHIEPYMLQKVSKPDGQVLLLSTSPPPTSPPPRRWPSCSPT